MEFKYLQTFKTIVEEGSFSKAAIKLNYTQPTITFQIGQLEQEFSTKLFEKVGRCMKLTKAGEQIYPYINDVPTSVDRLHYFKNDLNEYEGTLTDNLHAIPFGTYPLALVSSPELQKTYPDFITPNQYLPVPFIINEKVCVFRQIFEQYLQKNRSCLTTRLNCGVYIPLKL